MDIKKIVEDVINDFEYRPELEMEVHSDGDSYHVVFVPTYDAVGDALVEGIKPFASELKPWQVYCLCNKCLYGMGIHNLIHDVNSMSKDELKELVNNEIHGAPAILLDETYEDLDLAIDIDDRFSYNPEHLEKINRLSNQIATEAENVVIHGKAKSIDVEGLLTEMVALREELESFEHEYWNPETSLWDYDMEISESKSDVNTINALNSLASLRLREAVKDYVEVQGNVIHRSGVSDEKRQEAEQRLQELKEWMQEQEKKSQELDKYVQEIEKELEESRSMRQKELAERKHKFVGWLFGRKEKH